MEWLDIEYMKSELLDILTEERNKIRDNEEDKSFFEDIYTDEDLEEKAEYMANEYNDDMEKFIKSKDYNIPGNFKVINHNYTMYKKGYDEFKVLPEEDTWYGLVDRLEKNDQSEKTKADRKWLVDWFFEAFGTFGICYNFSNEVYDTMYYWEQENVDNENK